MPRNQDMSEEFLKRIKNADPVSQIEFDENLIEVAIESGNRKAKAVRRRNSFLVAAGSGVLALSVFANLTIGPSAQTGLITLGAQQSAQTAAESKGLVGADGMASDKMMMINPFIYEYVAGSGLSTDGSTGHVYKVELDGDADVVLANLMRIFGVKGTTTQTIDMGSSAPSYQMLTAGSQDGSGKSINLSWTGSGSWWYSDPSAYPQAECLQMTTPDEGEAYCSNYKEQPATPELVPTTAEAKAEAIKIFKSIGFKVEATDIRVSSDNWGAWATASMQLNGEDTPIEYSISWSSIGKLASVSGHSMKFVDKGEFKTISAKRAVERLGDWRYTASISSSAYEKYFSNAQQVMPLGSEINSKDMIEPEIGVGPVSEPSPTTVVVEINKAAKTHVMIWDAAGNNWLVPGFIFISDGSYINPVFALEDGIVALPPKD